MRRVWTDDGWRKRFAIFPLFLSEGTQREVVWLEPYWSRFAGLYTEISLTDPRTQNTPDSQKESARGNES